MELPHATHKQTTFGWLAALQHWLAARGERRRIAQAALRPEPLRPEPQRLPRTRHPAAGLFNLAAPH